ncbi:hypothetical protein [Enterococcus plantarum]|uniref:hypothetical protein n=1 Tax=Enterococcus plantarum TaxID=1077675 RepID=UPI001F5E3BE1|nr:hypothetical protein [Enterococcus plantarum]
MYSLTNDNDLTVNVTNLGVRIADLIVPVKVKMQNIVLGFISWRNSRACCWKNQAVITVPDKEISVNM